ncbi:hypothetical protein OPU71_20640 [Niveibacterium sp. 24ML]|uniref:hypothetical protein n=1 Tax=Niveibacterium sp. 24ML TaxID=2985512 RepID=UPI00226D4408|nr:hypothetical protein [Niveibacterium sp. 24ML]MCX9158538.1 hypothetical protein [Niveibacterium sp. 24ML]
MTTPISGSSAGSATSTTSTPGSASPVTDEVRAGTLWTFIHAQASRFTFDEALEVVCALRIDQHEDHKTLAKRLRIGLQTRGIALKHVNALHAAAQLLGQGPIKVLHLWLLVT